ncbi:MAG: hypothetical protein KAS72_00255 [Phycisphaerales bacterium]|nr:hypothetical protein [Phycisphaerales bacterium]
MKLWLLTLATTCIAAQPAAAERMLDEYGHRSHGDRTPAVTMDEPGLRKTPLPADWHPLGPFGGDADDVAASPTDPDIVLAGLAPSSGSGTMYRSTDGGATWTQVPDLAGEDVYDIEFTPGGIVYAGTGHGPWKSTDGGVNWTQIDLGIGLNQQTFEVEIDPSDADTIWVGVADAMGNNPYNVMVSINGGTTWTDRTPAMGSPMGCEGISVDPNDPNSLFACFGGGFGGGQVWFSSDGGASWANRSSGIPANPLFDVVYDGTRALLCGGQNFGSQVVGVYLSTNDGVTWTPLHDASWTSKAINDLDVDPNDSDIIYAATDGKGLFRSTDGGTNWSFSVGGTSNLTVRSVRFAPGSSTNIYLGNGSTAVYRSTDGGANFYQSAAGIGSLNVVDIAANPNDCEEFAIAFQGLNDGGVYTSTNAGTGWVLAALPATRFNTVGFAPDGTLYAISDGPTTVAPEGLYRRNIDDTWTCIGPDQGTYFESELVALWFSETDSTLIMTGGADFGVAGFEATVWRSTDTGANWTKVYEGTADHEDVADIVFTGTAMLAGYVNYGGPQIGGILRSDDGGDSWSASSTGLDAGRQVRDLEVAGSTIYTADEDLGHGGLFASTDDGLSWSNAGFTGQVHGVVVDPVDMDNIFLLQKSGTRVYMSEDGGGSFAAYNTGLAAAGTVQALKYVHDVCDWLLVASTTGSWMTLVQGLAADLDGDGDVDQADLGILLASYGINGDGDIDGDGDTDQADLGILLSQYNMDC